MSPADIVLQNEKLKADFPEGIKPFERVQPLVRPFSYKLWKLEENYHYVDKLVFDGEVLDIDFTISKGFKFDGCSVPRWLKRLTNGANNPQKLLAALIHDYIYFKGNYSKEVADMLFAKLLKEHDVETFIVWQMKWGVVLFAGWAWQGHRDRQEKLNKEG